MDEKIVASLYGARMDRDGDRWTVTLMFKLATGKSFEVELDKESSARASISADGSVTVRKMRGES